MQLVLAFAEGVLVIGTIGLLIFVIVFGISLLISFLQFRKKEIKRERHRTNRRSRANRHR